MKNIKEQVYNALCSVTENVSDSYPRTWADDSTIQYTEEQNNVYEWSSDSEGIREEKSYVRYRIESGIVTAHLRQLLQSIRQ